MKFKKVNKFNHGDRNEKNEKIANNRIHFVIIYLRYHQTPTYFRRSRFNCIEDPYELWDFSLCEKFIFEC